MAPNTTLQKEDRRRTYILFAIATLACALGSLSQTAVNSMLGGIDATFGTSANVSQWLTTIYMLTIGVTVPVVTHLSRRFSVRTLILVSLLFTLVGAISAALAPTFAVLIVARILQAIGCGITLPIIQTIAMTRFPPGQNATAMGIAGIAMGFAPNIGPPIGGGLVGSLGWRSFFWILLAATVVLIACTLLFVRKRQHDASDAHLDFPSFMLSTLGFGGLLCGFSNAADMGFASGWVLIPLVIGVAFLVAFFMRQSRIEFPLISLRIFQSKTYTASFIAQNFLFASFMGITLILPLFVINICGLGALEAGMVFLPNTIFAIVFNPLAGILADKLGARPVVVASAAILVVGAVPLAFVDAQTPIWVLTLWQTIRGIGVSSLIGPLNSWGMSKLDPAIMIDGSAFFTTVRQACASFGTALMMMLIAFCGGGVLGFHFAFGLSGLFSVCVLVCAAVTVGRTKS